MIGSSTTGRQKEQTGMAPRDIGTTGIGSSLSSDPTYGNELHPRQPRSETGSEGLPARRLDHRTADPTKMLNGAMTAKSTPEISEATTTVKAIRTYNTDGHAR